MAAFEIEAGVEVPKAHKPRGRQAKYPWHKMEVGDSILVEGEAASASKCKAYSSANTWGARNGVKFTGRTVGERKVRIWRIE